ncbi:type II secretion system ATPase GspE [candidate division KSB1 bacterium]|nr:type II secretion system ATPase GspE [candidate division KSB1 bacterium]
MQKGVRLKIGDLLLTAGAIDEDQLKKGLQLQKQKGMQLGKALIQLGVTTQEKIMEALSEQLELPSISLNTYHIDTSVLANIDENFARTKKILPLFKLNNTLTIAMVDPLDVFTLDELGQKLSLEIEAAVCTEEDLNNALDLYYGTSGKVDEVVQFIQEKEKEEEQIELEEIISGDAGADEAPIIRLVNLIFSQAIKEKASDIHIEPEEDLLRVRFRVDGVLHEMFVQPKNLQYAVTSRIKIMAELNIAERRLPQDGRFQIRVDNHDVDIRVSTIPSAHGENIVLRILDKSNLIVNLDDLGFTKKSRKEFATALDSAYGVIIVSGPTGSGKTTTLYSALHSINSLDKNIITIEDPIEYRMKIIRQSQVNTKIGMTFAAGLRSILRQDPDIIMVGEIRDSETASVAVQAALTGHLVLTTLHTNDASGAVTRLVDMGIEPFLVSSSVMCVVAQRLVRKICQNCKYSYDASDALIKELKLQPGKKYTFYKGKGCRNCKETGYKGRIAIFELLMINDDIRRMILEQKSSLDIRDYALKNGMKTLRQDGILKANNGKTTVEEVMHSTQAII